MYVVCEGGGIWVMDKLYTDVNSDQKDDWRTDEKVYFWLLSG